MFDNEPYQKYIDNDWLELIENTVVLSNGEIKITKKPLVKPKGQIGIVKMLKKYCA
ncbi:MAG: phage antirepressor KilAC domain-containing protein [Clostridiales bacterium]|nr:phage antirepressor KilAC domain-containing protein [Clostridiales bacterium]